MAELPKVGELFKNKHYAQVYRVINVHEETDVYQCRHLTIFMIYVSVDDPEDIRVYQGALRDFWEIAEKVEEIT